MPTLSATSSSSYGQSLSRASVLPLSACLHPTLAVSFIQKEHSFIGLQRRCALSILVIATTFTAAGTGNLGVQVHVKNSPQLLVGSLT